MISVLFAYFLSVCGEIQLVSCPFLHTRFVRSSLENHPLERPMARCDNINTDLTEIGFEIGEVGE
jgi:hypothetical protein